ncbi:MAG: hypothetical protein ACOWYE_14975 [Desulfatiglandales bacterium]
MARIEAAVRNQWSSHFQSKDLNFTDVVVHFEHLGPNAHDMKNSVNFQAKPGQGTEMAA